MVPLRLHGTRASLGSSLPHSGSRSGCLTQIPDIIGPYEVVRPVAQGGMAEVYEVRDPASGERLALKLLVEMKSNIKRFNREFEALTRLNHPGIVRVFRYGYHGRNPWITMELLEGVPLQSRVKSFGPPGTPSRTEEVIRIGYFIASALQYLHDRGLVHRDLKSANVQVLPDGRIKIIDFGTAHVSDPLERITADGDFIGTFSYAAPEQLLGSRVDHRADLYALGVLLYRLTTGRRPFKASDPRKVARMHLEKPPRPPREFVPELPKELETVILWLLEKKARDRPQNASDVASALEEIAGHPLTLPGQGIAIHGELSIGREQEHRWVWHRFADEDNPVDGLLLLGGDPAERARFVRQIGRDAVKRGWRCIICRGSADPRVAVATALQALMDGDDRRDVLELAHLLSAISDVPHDAARDMLERARRVAVERLASLEFPVILVLEELARFDAEAFAPVVELATEARATGARLVLVGTADSPTSHGVQTLRGSVTRHEELQLEPLDVWNTALAVGGLLHRRPPPPEAARRIHDVTGGRPSFIEEFIRGMAAQGALTVRSDDGNRVDWEREWEGLDEITAGVQAEVRERVTGLALPARRVLEILDVLGARATPDRVAHGMNYSAGELGVVVRDLLEDGWVRVDDTGALLATDTLAMHYVGDTMTPARRALVHERLYSLVAKDPASPVKVRILQGVGRTAAALEASIPCVGHLLEAGRAKEALDLLDLLESSSSHPGLPRALRCRFHTQYALALMRVRPRDTAIMHSLRKANGLAESAELRAEVRLGLAELQRAIGHAANYRKMLDQAWEAVGDDGKSPAAVEVALRQGVQHRHSGELARSTQWFERALSRAVTIQDLELRDRARVGMAELLLARGNGKDAARAFQRVVDSPDASEVLRALALAGWAEAVRRQGRFSEVLGPLEVALVEARRGPSFYAHARVLLTSARVELDLFRLGRADEFIDELLGAMPEGERLELRLEARYVQGRIQLVSGQIGHATLQLGTVVDRADAAGMVVLAARARADLAQARWQMGDRRDAAGMFRKAYADLKGTGALEAFADVVVARARALAGAEDPKRCFGPVEELLDRSGFRILYLEHLLAEYRWHTSQGNEPLAQQSLRESAAVLGRIASTQNRIEQAAMRVHPWMKEIKRALVS